MELLENQLKQYNWEQDQINHMKVCNCSNEGKNRYESSAYDSPRWYRLNLVSDPE